MRWIWLGLLVGTGCDGGGEAESDPPESSPCEAGCVDTIAAACSNGPADQASCVSQCEALRVGSCGTEYEAVLTCSDGGAVTCDASGVPTVEPCATEFSAFVGCLNGT